MPLYRSLEMLTDARITELNASSTHALLSSDRNAEYTWPYVASDDHCRLIYIRCVRKYRVAALVDSDHFLVFGLTIWQERLHDS